MIIEETDVSSQETFPAEAVFYQLPGGLDHHLRAVHEKTVTEEILQSARRMSQDLVAQETLRNIKTLSSAGQADKTSRYIECTVYIEAEGPNEGETRADSDQNQSERKLTFFAKREKEAAKYYCLYLQHKGMLRSMEDRTKSYVVVVKSCNLLAKYLAWNSSSKLYLETCSSKLVRSLELIMKAVFHKTEVSARNRIVVCQKILIYNFVFF